MLACSIAIEKSTKEFTWIPGEAKDPNRASSSTNHSRDTNRRVNLLWVQPAQRVSDQDFDSYIIYAKGKEFIASSSRREDVRLMEKDKQGDALKKTTSEGNGDVRPKVNATDKVDQDAPWYSDLLAVTAIFAGGAGFTIQFIGLRGLPWPCAVAHLGAIIIMAMIRAMIRWRLGERAKAHIAPQNYELDFLATRLVDPWNDIFEDPDKNTTSLHKTLGWRVKTAKQGENITYNSILSRNSNNYNGNSSSEVAQHIVHVRKRLGDLCKWESRAFKSSLALVRSIERFLDQFLPEGAKPITWKIPFENSKKDVQIVELKITQGSEGQPKCWKINAGEVEAVLSLWIASLETNQISDVENEGKDEWQRSKAGLALGVDYCRNLGYKQDNGVLQRDIKCGRYSF
ncbi:hypothetical protein IL306_005742 [Fusarium sp. DS 682]|nr:hypothetical protein IL306_005742 [Fusarium sp. DS 682]